MIHCAKSMGAVTKRAMRLAAVAAVAAAASLCADAEPAEWSGLDPSCHIGGRKMSAGYLRGKVVLVDRWGSTCPPCRKLLPRMEHFWQCYKTKPFVLIGGHCRGMGTDDEARAQVAENALTYPVYSDAKLENEPAFRRVPFLYVVDATGRVVYKGSDERLAEESAVIALTNLASPPDAEYWKRLIDHDLAVLPGRALVKIAEFSKVNPAEAKAYAEDAKRLKGDAETVRLARLEAFARQAKDFDKNEKPVKLKALLSKIRAAIKSYEPMKELADPIKAQEAKNCIADLKWTEVELNAMSSGRR